MIWLAGLLAIVSTIAFPSLTSRTVPPHSTSCSGTPMPRNCNREALQVLGPPAASVCARAT